MKKIYLCLLSIASLVILSCGSDDSNDTGLTTINPDPTEEIALDPSTVSKNIIIDNGTRVDGNAPAPNGSLAFSLTETDQSAFQKNGFNITFNTPQNYGGAYIQIVSTDGIKAPDYWEVSGLGKSASSKLLSKRNKNYRIAAKSNQLENEIEIDVDFEDAITAGTFCYLICIYDTDGNISEPVEVCVEVEAWGGNPNLIGTWNLTKREVTYQENTNTDITGEETCRPYIIPCIDPDLDVEGDYCYTINLSNITLNVDGTLSRTYNETVKDFDYSATIENCEAIYLEAAIEDNHSATGNWFYNEEESLVVFVIFSETNNGEITDYETGYSYSRILDEVTTSTLTLNDPGIEAIKSFFTRE